jgi:hypothetical protein
MREQLSPRAHTSGPGHNTRARRVSRCLPRLFRARFVPMGAAAAMALFLTTFAAALPATADVSSAPVLPLGGTDVLSSGMVLHPSNSCSVFSCLTSPNGMYEATLQTDGNFVIYKITSSTTPIWSTRTNGYGNSVWLGNQGDGNLVLYIPNPTRPIWASGSNGRGAAYLQMQNDGNLVLYSAGHATWASGTSSSQRPTACNPAAPVLFGDIYNVETPYRPYQLDSTVIHGVGRVDSWSAACGSWLQVAIQRKVCNWTGCNWLDRVVSPKVPVNQRGWTFAAVASNCAAGTNRYRIRTTVYQPTVGDGGTGVWSEQYSTEPEFSC